MISFVILADRLSQQERLDALKQWSGGSDNSAFVTGLIYLALGVLVVVGVIAIVSAIANNRKRRVPRDPHKLFRQATIHLGMELSDRQLLLRIITARKIEHPVTLLMSPQTFDAETEAWLRTLSHDEAVRKRRHIDDIRRVVFSGTDWERVTSSQRSFAAPQGGRR